MVQFLEERLIDPSKDELIALLDRATRKANARRRDRRVERDAAAWRRFVQRHARARDGHVKYKGSRSSVDAATVAVAWWTDPLGRKHWRVQGRRTVVFDYWASLSPLDAYPVWHVYPERLMLREVGGERQLVALCGCGVAGRLDAIGWVGPSCGPCHDRREEGEPYAGPMHPVQLPGDGSEVRMMEFAPDRRLVVGYQNGRVRAWDPATWEGRSLISRHVTYLYLLRVSAAGFVAIQTAQRNQVKVGRLDDDPPTWPTQRMPCGILEDMAFTPDGSALLVMGTGGLFLVDPTGAAPPRALSRRRGIGCVGCLDAGTQALAFDPDAGVVRLDLTTGERVVVTPLPSRPAGRGARHPGQDRLYDCEFLDLITPRSPDGQWLVCEGAWVNSSQVHLYHVPTGRWLPLPMGEYVVPVVVGFTRRGEVLTLQEEATIEVWDVAERKLIGRLCLDGLVHGAAVTLSPDGELLAAAADDRGTVRLWPWRRLLGLA